MDQRVLVVDDDPFAVALLARYLSGYGYQAIKTLTASAALNVLRGPSPPRIVLSDWMMPVMDGLEFCRVVRSDVTIPFTYFIILTAMSEPGCEAEARNSGADDFLTKPLEYHHLLARVRAGQRVVEAANQLLASDTTVPVP